MRFVACLPSCTRWHAVRAGGFARAVVVGLAASATGCFNGNSLLEAKQEETNLVQLDEIDLGEFRLTLPGTLPGTNGGILEFHAFGQVAKRDRARVATILKLNEPEFRYRSVLAVRLMTEQDLSQPGLSRLRNELVKLANAPLEHGEIKSIGFYQYAFAPADKVAAATAGGR